MLGKPVRLGLPAKIFLGSTLLVVTVLGASLGITALSATGMAAASIQPRPPGPREGAASPLGTPGGAEPQGVLFTGLALGDSVAQANKQATTSDIVLFALDTLGRPHVVGSTLSREEVAPSLPDSAQLAALAQDTAMVRLDAPVGGAHLPGPARPIRSAGCDGYGGFVAFRSRDAELAAFRALRGTMAAALLLGVALAVGLALAPARNRSDSPLVVC